MEGTAVDLTPGRWEADVVAADGGTVHVRPITPDDEDRIVAFHSRQSAESIYFRYFSARPRLSASDLAKLVDIDGYDRMVFLALLGDDVVGVGRFDRYRHRDEAEVAFFVDEEHKGRGLATILLEYLAAVAREAGITAFTASVLPNNRRMLGVFRQAGFEAASTFADGVIEVRFPIEPTPGSEAAVAERAALAEAASVARLLAPGSVAVIGAGRARGMGHQILRKLLEHEFNGPVYPVNRDAAHVASVPAYPTVLDVPDRVDLAVIAVPVEEVAAVVDDCARAKVGALIVVTAGFGETGPEGLAAEQALVATARRHGMRLLGPNSLGAISTAPTVRLHASFSPVAPLAGRAALSSQSGSLAVSIVERARDVGLGLSAVVGVGNKGDVSGNDLLRYWRTDDRTDVVMLYLESFGNPRRFGRISRAVSAVKPIVAVKPSRDPMTDSLLDQTGVIRVDNLERMLGVARVLAGQPVPAGDRVVVIGNSGGPALLAAEACRGAGLEVARLGQACADDLLARLPDGARVDGPIDLTWVAGGAEYEAAVSRALADDGVDALLVVYCRGLEDLTEEVGRAIGTAAAAAPSKPVVASFPGDTMPEGLAIDGTRRIPSFAFPDAAAYALGRAAAYGRWRREQADEPATPDGVDAEAAAAIAHGALLEGDGIGVGRWLTPAEALTLLEATGLDVLPVRFVGDADAAVAAADDLGYPVALKATGLDHLGKSEAGGAALDLHDAGAVRDAHARMSVDLRAGMAVAAVQGMASPGVDVRIRLVQDDVAGAAVAVGPGGAAGERLPDDGVRLVPLTYAAAEALVRSSPTTSGLTGADRDALVDLVVRAGWLADHVPELAELVLNPVIVGGGRAAVADARARVAPWRHDQGVRRL